MRKLLLIGAILSIFLTGCGDKVLVVRSVLEADQYLRNNTPNMDWELFQQLLAKDSTVTEEDLDNFKNILHGDAIKKSSFTKLDNTLYRFSKAYNIIYVVKFKEEDGELKLYSLDYIKKA